MIRLSLFHVPLPNVARAKLQAYWRSEYAEAVKERRSALGLERYAQVHVDPFFSVLRAVISVTRSAPFLHLAAFFSGQRASAAAPPSKATQLNQSAVVEAFTFPDRVRPGGSEEATGNALRALQEHWRLWCHTSFGMIGEEHMIKTPTGDWPPTKIMFCLRRRESSSREEMQAYWREKHTPLATTCIETMGAAAYEQTHSLSPSTSSERLQAWTGTNVAEYDGIASINFASRRTLFASLMAPRTQRANMKLVVDEFQFVSPSTSEFLVGDEYVFPLA